MFSIYSVSCTPLFISIIIIAIICNERYHIECIYSDSSNVKEGSNEMTGTEVYRIKRDGGNSKYWFQRPISYNDNG